MRARDLRRLIGTDTLVDCDEAFNINGWTCTEGKVLKYDSRGCFLVSGKWRNKNGTTAIEWYVLPRDIRLHVPAKKSPEVGSAKQPKPAPTFQVGDVVDCDGSCTSSAKVFGGKVIGYEYGAFTVEGKWSDGREWRCCRSEQMRHHVAKEEAKVVDESVLPKTLAGRLEMLAAVHRPSHYTWIPGIECKDVAKHFSCMVGQAIQYQWRHLHKGKPVEDLEKAVECLKVEIARLKKGTK